MRGPGGALSANDADLETARAYSQQVKIACDELHADPFNPMARAALVRLIERESSDADAALARISNDWIRVSGQ